MSLSVDPTAWNIRRARVQREVSGWSAGVAREVATAAGMHVLAMAPVDTGRYVRAVAQAVNAAGGGPLPVRSVSASGRHARVVELLSRQAADWGRYLAWREKRLAYLYPRGAPSRGRTAAFRRMQSEVRMASRRLARAREELRKALANDDALLMGHINSGRAQSGRQLLTVRTKIYGGVGRVEDTPRGAQAVLTILEPHGRFLERRLRLFARAKRSPLVVSVLARAERELAGLCA